MGDEMSETTTYRISYYRPGQSEPCEVREITGLDRESVQVKADEWREWSGGRATIDVVAESGESEASPVRYAARYGNRFANGQSVEYIMSPWDYRPMAERDARWKLSDGWDFAEVIVHRLASGGTRTEWPPRQGDLWRDSDGDLWFGLLVDTDHTKDGAYVILEPSKSSKTLPWSGGLNAEIDRQHGPMTLVHRELAA